MKNVLTIAGSDPSGGAGIQADLKTFSYFKVYGMAVITALTAQNSRSVDGVNSVSPEFVQKQLDSVLRGADIHSVKTGMLASSEITQIVGTWIKNSNIPFVVADPVFDATSGSTLTQLNAKDAYINSLFPYAALVTPNIPEAELLTGIQIKTVDDMKRSAEIIYNQGPKYVLVKGGHLDGEITDILFDGSEFRAFEASRIEAKSYHGTGCALSSAIAALFALKGDIYTAVKEGIDYVRQAIKNSISLGKGHFGLNHIQQVHYE